MIQYPNICPPLREGYGFNPVSPLARTELQSGRARQRRRFTSVPTMASVRWRLTDTEAMLFEAWFRDQLVDGSQWFECPLKTPETPNGLRTYIARFTDIYDGPDLVSGSLSLWDFTATLELRERPILDPGWTILPEFILHPDIFDIAMNREWPEA
ncbi:TPA: hypothetical protein ACRMX2_003751 [Pseudomonas aeruginosa]|uniref:hypothetical protein n=1 Tax=Pseudomonas aeruginosa TaxID=287 RepID=UPI00071BD961|nr:hypothetical protein [Pseudomonas aeruginosa]KSG12381.1 hypothetical protein AO943_20165 [Pseudomonas aeruginosa]MBV5856588.1 hypothetical protein [Pseudomonas aeruginosa]MCS8090244.1 hypothetical protein [Pseudomonas aeruginosa]MCS8692684.1 hypothetical protein [Pseudomonas aeruginosa]MCS8698725.1 hypothetical protein [Pseudomonas aeruginosa]